MDDINKAIDKILLSGPRRQDAIDKFLKQMDEWGDVVPKAKESYVLDFGLGEFEKYGLIEYWIANEFDLGYCGKYLFVFDGQSCPCHWHIEKHETFYMLRGSVEMICDGVITIMNPGDILPMNVGAKHGFKGIGDALLLEISKPCFVDDNYYEDLRVPLGK